MLRPQVLQPMRNAYAILCILLLGFGCAPHIHRTGSPGDTKPRAATIPGVPAFAQEKNQCGAAALASVLAWSGVQIQPDDLVPLVYNPQRKGTLQSAVISAARRQGRIAYRIHGPRPLNSELQAGHPVLVLMNRGLKWWPVWHYAVVCGYSEERSEVLVAQGKADKQHIAWSFFSRMWKRAESWGLLVLRPDDLPATATKDSWIRAVAGLEQAGEYAHALTGYNTALKKWPQSLGAMLGKANCHYALDRLEQAETALRRAAAAHPDSATVHNNLAHVLLKQGKLQNAMESVQTAQEIGGPHTPAFEQTRTEIRRHLRFRKQSLQP